MRNVLPIPEDGKMEAVAEHLEEILYALLYEIGSVFRTGATEKIN